MRWRRGLGAILLTLVLPSAGAARTIGFSVEVDHPLLAWAIARHLGIPDGGHAVLWGAPEGCHSLVVDAVQVETADTGELRVSVHGAARVGFGFLGLCIVPFGWHGFVDITGRPVIGDDWQLRLAETRLELADDAHARARVATRVLALVQDHVAPAVDDFHLDLTPPTAEVRALLRASVSGPRAAPVVAALATLRPADVAVGEQSTQVHVTMDVQMPASESAPESAPEPALDEAAEDAWQAALERWDAFLTFIVKDVATLGEDPGIRDDLLTLLLTDRHTLLAALRTQPQSGVDPVRQLFLDSWSDLRGIARRAIMSTRTPERGLRYVSFLAAGDALAALDALGAEAGVSISADGLRRLARLVSPDALEDPLAYTDRPDPGLRTLFGFRDPPATPPAETAPTAPAPEPESWWRRLGPTPALAAEVPDDLATIGHQLDRWVPGRDQLDAYRAAVDRLLGVVAANASVDLEPRFATLYPRLVRTTAWQESCWRQFVSGTGGRVTYLVSGSGDVGMMQVNRRVWRGFFALEKLKWDVVYNAGAGAEILARLLGRVGAREGTDRLDNAARATYSAYNGGPAAYRRYREPHVSRQLRAIDEMFWEKYQRMSAGGASDAVLCM